MNAFELKDLAMARLEAFQRGAVPLHQLVGDLQSILDNLPKPEPSWKLDFDKYNFALEEVNALRLDESNRDQDGHEDFVKATVQKLKDLLEHSE
jgi:hypothetical protein